MNGTIIDVINAGTICLVLMNAGQSIVEVPVDHRMMLNIVASRGLSDPSDLRGDVVEAGDGWISFADEALGDEVESGIE